MSGIVERSATHHPRLFVVAANDAPDEDVQGLSTALDMLRRDKWENACEEMPEGQSVPADGGEFRALVEIIRRMPEDYRRVLELRFVAEWSISDIARELGLTESAVRTRTFRGRKLLIDTLKKEGYLDERATV